MSRGGKREGAGRPAMEDKREQLSLSVAPKTKKWMRQMSAEQGVPMGVILEVLIDAFEESSRETF